MKKFRTIVTGLMAGMPLLTLAQFTGIQEPRPVVRNIEGIIRIFNTVINYFFTFLLIVATIFVFIAAFKYLTAAGDDEKVKSAHATIIYAAVAIAVALLAQGIRFIVGQLVGVPVQQ